MSACIDESNCFRAVKLNGLSYKTRMINGSTQSGVFDFILINLNLVCTGRTFVDCYNLF